MGRVLTRQTAVRLTLIAAVLILRVQFVKWYTFLR